MWVSSHDSCRCDVMLSRPVVVKRLYIESMKSINCEASRCTLPPPHPPPALEASYLNQKIRCHQNSFRICKVESALFCEKVR